MNKLFLLLVFWNCASFSFGQQTIPEKVLFIGNSYTYFWNLPQTVSLMAEEGGMQIDVDHSTAGGANWGQHWRGEKELITRKRIQKGNYDAVILQNHSLSTIQRADSFLIYGKKFGELIKATGAQPYVYMTWAREYDPYTQKTINEGYVNLAEKINARIVPVGPAWQRARELRPEIKLYHFDGSHQSTLGTYLSACVFYGVLTGKSPIGLPPRLYTTDQDGERIYLTFQAPNDAIFCQKVADEIIREWVD